MNFKYTLLMAIKVLYTVCLALLVALFVGSGIAAFYPAPKQPEFPSKLQRSEPLSDNPTAAEKARRKEADRLQQRFDRDTKKFQRLSASYNRDVSMASLIAAVIILMISLTLLKQIMLLSDGLLLGGALTLIYSIIRGFAGDNDMFRFIVVGVGTAVTVAIGYIRFVKGAESG